MAVDWDAIEQKYNNFKEYAKPGVYDVKVEKCEFKTVSTGSIAQEFYFVEDDAKYPKATHWLSFNNDNWRAWHNRKLMELLGLTEEQAKKSVEMCEGKSGKENITKAYDQVYKKLLAKKPAVKIEVYQDGKYTNADFIDGSVRMNKPEKAVAKTPSEEILESGEDVSDDISDLPF